VLSSLANIRDWRIIIAWGAFYSPQNRHTNGTGPFMILLCDWHIPETAVWLDSTWNRAGLHGPYRALLVRHIGKIDTNI
jgi:hypothetical protein